MNRTLSNIICVIALATGILLLVAHSAENLFSWIVRIIGILLLLPSLGMVVKMFTRKSQARIGTEMKAGLAWTILICGLAGIVFGVLLLAMTAFWTQYVYIVLGAVLFICGLYYVACLWSWRRNSDVKLVFIMVPIVATIAGIWIIAAQPDHTVAASRNYMTIVTGVLLALFALNGLWCTLAIHLSDKARRLEEEERKEHEEAEKTPATEQKEEEEEIKDKDPDGIFE